MSKLLFCSVLTCRERWTVLIFLGLYHLWMTLKTYKCKPILEPIEIIKKEMIQIKCYLWFLTKSYKSWWHGASTHIGRTFSVCHLLHKSEKNMKTLKARCRFILWYTIGKISLNLFGYEKILLKVKIYAFFNHLVH